eukprot:Em0012g675a
MDPIDSNKSSFPPPYYTSQPVSKSYTAPLYDPNKESQYYPAPPAYNRPAPPAYISEPTQPGNVPIAVVISQPPSYVVHADRYTHGDHYFMLSIILSIICFCCGSWLSLLCTIPAIVFAAAAQDAEIRGDSDAERKNSVCAITLNIIAIFSFMILWFILIAVMATRDYQPPCYSTSC